MISQETVRNMVQAADIMPGDIVLVHFWGAADELPVAEWFMTAVLQSGGAPFLLQQDAITNAQRFNTMESNPYTEAYMRLFSRFSIVFDIYMCPPVIPHKTLKKEKLPFYRAYMQDLSCALQNARKLVQIRMPVRANAPEQLPETEFVQRMERALQIDYRALKAACQSRVAELETQQGLVIATGATDTLTVDCTGRKWVVDAGDGDLPCGEIYIAPVEQRTNGSLWFDTLYWEDECFRQIRLLVQNGVVHVDMDTPSADRETLRLRLAELPTEAVVCELGFGMNEQVSGLCGYAVLDEKAANTCHIAIGNNQLFGGASDAPYHIDFVLADYTIQFC